MSYMYFFPIKIRPKHFLPKAHGAWAMWITPLIMGMVFTGFTSGGILLFFTAMTLFIIHHPVSMTLLKKNTRQYRNYFMASIISCLSFIGLGGYLMYQYFSIELLLIGTACVIIFSLHLFLVKKKLGMTAAGQITGIAGLTLTAPAVYLINSGTIDGSSLLLWLFNFLYFTSAIPYIRLKIRVQSKISGTLTTAKKLRLGLPAIVLSGFPITIMTMLGLYQMVIPFLPGIMKSVVGSVQWQPGEKVQTIRLGMTEFIFTVLFIFLTWWVRPV